jgi:intracellular septation protein A
MNEVPVLMALYDLLPVLLFFAAAVILQRDLYGKLVKGAYALLATGSVLVLLAGVYKALYKILLAIGLCEYPILGKLLFPLQAPGFLFVFLSLLGTLLQKKKQTVLLSAAVPVYDGMLPFIALEVVSCAGFQICLALLALRMKKRSAAALFLLSLFGMLIMGWLSAKFDSTEGMNWLAQSVNTLWNGALLAGVWLLHRSGLAGTDVFRREERHAGTNA